MASMAGSSLDEDTEDEENVPPIISKEEEECQGLALAEQSVMVAWPEASASRCGLQRRTP